MTAAQIIKGVRLSIWDIHHHLCAYNCCALGWEADFLAVHNSGWCEEVEIKVSMSDYRADFTGKPDKHAALQRGEIMRGWPRAWHPIPVRRFWYAAPYDLAERISPILPDYCGLIRAWVDRRGVARAERVVQAPNIQRARRVTEREQVLMMRSMAFRAWDRFPRNYRHRQAEEPSERLELMA